uniref:ATP-dependent helicase n=1 Tax=Globisporangium ultimum (strain ATCC 200006 / CBS 805.95 / DAOM BR144) TaxID=431595 RepID=K3WMP5_GLOUD
MALGVKESVSGKRFALAASGDEVRVCGGKGAVYISGPKVALRCCGKTSIVATKKMKQSVLRQGDVTLLELRDVFYANGTLTKYEIIDIDGAAANKVSLSAASGPVLGPSFGKPAAAATAAARVAKAPPAQVNGAATKHVSAYFAKPADASSAQKGPQKVQQPPPAKADPPATVISLLSPVKQVGPKDVSELSAARTSEDVQTSATKKRMASIAIVDDDFSNDSDVGEEEEIAPTKPRVKKTRVIIESDGDDDEEEEDAGDDDKAVDVTMESNVESPMEDDVFVHELKLKKEKDGVTPKAANWMAEFGRKQREKQREKQRSSSSKSSSSPSDGWHSISDLKEKRKQPKPATQKARRDKFQARDDGEDDSEEDHHTRTHDEVGQLLRDCERIAEKLRKSIKSWSGGPAASSSPSAASANDDGAEDEDHVSIAAINSTDGSAGGRRVVTQDDIPNICETLVLNPYQVVGVNWLLLLCENSVSGVLADEMGLGKTVQTISFLLLLDHLSKTKQSRVCGGPHLVVVPASVLNNWKREFAWIAPTLRIVVYHGAKEDRLNIQESLASDEFDVLLTTYTYFERDSCQDDRNFLRNFHFGYMILDEGHSIKNSKTSRFKRISAMRSRNRLVLSGTPIQNNLNELLALLSFLMPRMFDHGSDELLMFFDGNEQKKSAKVRKILAPFILRREKKYVLSQLVPKTVHVEMLRPGETQLKVYTDLIESVIKQKESEAARKLEEKERRKNSKTKFDRQVQILLGLSDTSAAKSKGGNDAANDSAIFTQLRKAANHPVLLRNHYVSDEVLSTMSRCLHRADAFGSQCSISMVRKELESYSDFELHDLCVQYAGNEELRKLQLPMETLLASAKFDYLRGLLPKLKAEGHRVLIFSQWTKLLDLLEVLMSHMEYRYMRLDGSTDVQERQGMIDTYNDDKGIFVFLLSTRAGGLGINLTAADTVILHDLDFNPTNDEQACDRCHRIGQTKPVSIYKLVSENTVDHDIFKLGEVKTQLNHAVLGKLNAHSDKSEKGSKKSSDTVTVEMMLSSVISNYKKQ